MTSKLYYKAHIHDVQSQNCTEDEANTLMDIFEGIIKKASALLIKRAEFSIGEFSIAKLRKLDDFSLHIERQYIEDQEQWTGTFQYQNKSLSILASLEIE